MAGTSLFHGAPKPTIDQWLGNRPLPEVPLLRTVAWNHGLEFRDRPPGLSEGSAERSTGEGPAPPFGLQPHSDIMAVSSIRMSLWDKAQWNGMAFEHSDDPRHIPVMAFVFKEPLAAEQILRGWHRDLVANELNLRIAVIRRIDRRNPSWYRVIVGSHLPKELGPRLFTALTRIHTLTPTDGANLDRFLEAFTRTGKYALSFAQAEVGQEPDINREMALGSHGLVVRDAWTIGLHDPDVMGIRPDDDPVVPKGMAHPPIEAVLDLKRQEVAPISGDVARRLGGHRVPDDLAPRRRVLNVIDGDHIGNRRSAAALKALPGGPPIVYGFAVSGQDVGGSHRGSC